MDLVILGLAKKYTDDSLAGKDGFLKGDKGEKGEPGKDGYTPVRGTDYWTEEDKKEIKSLVDEITGEKYQVYVSNGKLMMKKVEE